MKRAWTVGSVGFFALLMGACDGGTQTTGGGHGGDGGDAGHAAQGGGGSGGTGAQGGSGGSGGQGGAAAGGGGSGGGQMLLCDILPGPTTPTEVLDTLNGSEDIAFDGKGFLAGKDGGQVVAVAPGQKTPIGNMTGTVYGLRYDATGALIAARPNNGKLEAMAPDGTVTDYVTGLAGPNGVYPDANGNVWVTEFGGGKVTKIAPDKSKTTVASINGAPNGVVFDAERNLVFFTDYSKGTVHSVGPDGGTIATVGEVNGGALDGLVMDACGNLYAVDQGNSDIYLFALDAAGALIGNPVKLAHFPSNVANAQFGWGPGWNATSLYVAGVPGVVYELPVGIPGAPIVLPP